ncbi:MAG: DUF5682 family protein [Hydrogenophaga sp.]|jgi:hypothetical protein|uniref:DUF5682 family protein n=1 Tax=Hydrogenophaga sp. TaxID=1904254 RepID=UPI00271C127D|nr:DUF5682 family protein [Hydrogenophaga sp.]MDO9568600.1 DUF5682 family protein [Hydrogenophaga sp.]
MPPATPCHSKRGETVVQPRIIGIRHHSPACARLVAHALTQDRPAAVLIEGPADFNARMAELLLPHRLPLALYSYAHTEQGVSQCWFPLVDHSPEWVALKQGHAQGATVRFVDLPHWQYRTLPAQARHPLAAPDRYARLTQALAQRLACDGDHALWDHLFESQALDHAAAFQALEQRLAVYFHDLRGDPAQPTTPDDAAREDHMAQWLAWACQHFAGQPVLLVCGGWHKRAIEALWPTRHVPQEPTSPAAPEVGTAGAYLVPCEYRQLEALAGYAAGMQSPQYYQWLMQRGAGPAARQATQAIVQRLRAKKLPLSTADWVAFEATLTGLARLRGHAEPLRVDILDAVQSAFVKEALDAPAPWSGHRLLTTQDHPVLREALLALTGEGSGQLAPNTPLPPLVADVARRLADSGLSLSTTPQTKVLDRRHPADLPAAHTLWQLKLLGIEGITLTQLRVPTGTQHLHQTLAYEEHWHLVQHPRWLPSLIEAAAHGSTLAAAARACLLARLTPDPSASRPPQPSANDLAQGLTEAIRAGFFDLGDALAHALTASIQASHHHGELATAAQLLLDVATAGFWGQDTRPMLLATLQALGERLLWLLDALDMPQHTHPHTSTGTAAATQPASPHSRATLDADVAAVRALGGLLRLGASQPVAGFDADFALACLLRFARSAHTPPALRGAAAGLACTQAHRYPPDGGLAPGELVALMRAIPPRTQLGDYLFGLFALTRALVQDQPELVQALHDTLAQMSHQDFIAALPALREAFAWFPPRERGHMAAQVAGLLGLSAPERNQLTQLPQGGALYLHARRTESQALAWAQACGLLEPPHPSHLSPLQPLPP